METFFSPSSLFCLFHLLPRYCIFLLPPLFLLSFSLSSSLRPSTTHLSHSSFLSFSFLYFPPPPCNRPLTSNKLYIFLFTASPCLLLLPSLTPASFHHARHLASSAPSPPSLPWPSHEYQAHFSLSSPLRSSPSPSPYHKHHERSNNVRLRSGICEKYDCRLLGSPLTADSPARTNLPGRPSSQIRGVGTVVGTVLWSAGRVCSVRGRGQSGREEGRRGIVGVTQISGVGVGRACTNGGMSWSPAGGGMSGYTMWE